MSELENIKTILDYLDKLIYQDNPPSLNEWLKSETERLQKEYFNLSVINADDKDIISQALIDMSNEYRANNQFQVSNKIDEVRKRFLDGKTEKYVKTNFNFRIKVKLNERGKQIHYNYWKDICRDAKVPYELETDEQGYSSFQIHEFMHIFGPEATLAAEPFLETNDILIERSEE